MVIIGLEILLPQGVLSAHRPMVAANNNTPQRAKSWRGSNKEMELFPRI
ncbi:MAG: hypothetical protein WA865_09980 [Spirulinaceae cyanobacterium]